jgi:hypothetical protein
MANISVVDGNVSVALNREEKLGAMHGDFSFPVTSITSCRACEEPISEVRGVKSPGAGFPNRKFGTWRGSGYKDFVSVRRGEPGFVLELDDQPFTRVIVSLSDTASIAAALAACHVSVTHVS